MQAFSRRGGAAASVRGGSDTGTVTTRAMLASDMPMTFSRVSYATNIDPKHHPQQHVWLMVTGIALVIKDNDRSEVRYSRTVDMLIYGNNKASILTHPRSEERRVGKEC